MTPQQQQYYLYQQQKRTQINQLYYMASNLKAYIAAGGDPMKNPDLSAQYLYLDGLGYFTFEDQDTLHPSECNYLQV